MGQAMAQTIAQTTASAGAAAGSTTGGTTAPATAAPPQTIVCEFCHSKIDGASRFCPECGQQLE
jgi:hypothetical protein